MKLVCAIAELRLIFEFLLEKPFLFSNCSLTNIHIYEEQRIIHRSSALYRITDTIKRLEFNEMSMSYSAASTMHAFMTKESAVSTGEGSSEPSAREL